MNPQGSPLASLVPMLLIFGIFYFLVIRPQQKQEKQRQKMLSELKTGDKVITMGGLIGTIESINENEIALKLAQSVKVQVMRWAITHVVTEGEKLPAAQPSTR